MAALLARGHDDQAHLADLAAKEELQRVLEQRQLYWQEEAAAGEAEGNCRPPLHCACIWGCLQVRLLSKLSQSLIGPFLFTERWAGYGKSELGALVVRIADFGMALLWPWWCAGGATPHRQRCRHGRLRLAGLHAPHVELRHGA